MLAAVRSYAKAVAAAVTGADTFLMFTLPGNKWAQGAIFGLNAALVYLIPNAPVARGTGPGVTSPPR